jgi:hypothetical protein
MTCLLSFLEGLTLYARKGSPAETAKIPILLLNRTTLPLEAQLFWYFVSLPDSVIPNP